MAAPDFLVVGHVVKDIVPGGWRLGGTAAYAALQAARLGLRAGVVTAAAPDLDLGSLAAEAQVHAVPSERSTTFENIYGPEGRTQYLRDRACPLTAQDAPAEWRTAPVVLLGPVCGEVPPDMGSLFPGALAGVSAQGWLRRVGSDQRVRPCPWPRSRAWGKYDALFVSEEDLMDDGSLLERWTVSFPVVALTRAARGASLHQGGVWRHIEAFPEREVDPTGAGDVFAAAFLALLAESGDVAEAARFASAAAAISVGAEGTTGIPTRAQVEERLARHPEVVLR